MGADYAGLSVRDKREGRDGDRALSLGPPRPTLKDVISYAFVDGFTRIPREEAVARHKRAIAGAHGVIVDFAFFEVRAIRLTVELDAASLAVLRRGLADAEVELFTQCDADLDVAKLMAPSHPIVAMLHVAFVTAEVDVNAEAAHLS